jgi:hypothetical protein
MTFEEWFKKEHGSCITRGQVEDRFGDYQPFWVEQFLREAFEAGYELGYDAAYLGGRSEY